MEGYRGGHRESLHLGPISHQPAPHQPAPHQGSIVPCHQDNEPSTPEVKIGCPEEKLPESDCVITGYGKVVNEQRYSYHGKLFIDEGWKWITKFHKPQPSKTRHLYCMLNCNECSPTGWFGVYVPSTSLNQAKQDTFIARIVVMNVLLLVGLGFMFLAKNFSNITSEQWAGGNRALFKDSLPWQAMTYIANHLLSRNRI
jgi:hypothetical protein